MTSSQKGANLKFVKCLQILLFLSIVHNCMILTVKKMFLALVPVLQWNNLNLAKILEKSAWRSSFLVKLQAYSWQLYQMNSFTGIFKDFT